MAMVFCRGCGKEIHDSASACPHCGAFQGYEDGRPGSAGAKAAANGDAVVWTLAFAPLIGEALAWVLAHALHATAYAAETALGSGRYFWVPLLLNIGLCVTDEKRLAKAGVDTQRLGSAFLVPVYLFKRAALLGHQPPAYFIVWVVCFAAALLGTLA